MSLSANYFKLENYSELDLTQIKEINNVNSCELIIDAENNYAFKTQIQGYMINEQNQIIDSLFIPGQNTIEQADVTSGNEVVGPVSSQLISFINKDKLSNLMQCKKIKFVSMMYLHNQPTPIKINNDSYLKIDVSANLNYHVNVK